VDPDDEQATVRADPLVYSTRPLLSVRIGEIGPFKGFVLEIQDHNEAISLLIAALVLAGMPTIFVVLAWTITGSAVAALIAGVLGLAAASGLVTLSHLVGRERRRSGR
jgi:hypothetical protein